MVDLIGAIIFTISSALGGVSKAWSEALAWGCAAVWAWGAYLGG